MLTHKGDLCFLHWRRDLEALRSEEVAFSRSGLTARSATALAPAEVCPDVDLEHLLGPQTLPLATEIFLTATLSASYLAPERCAGPRGRGSRVEGDVSVA